MDNMEHSEEFHQALDRCKKKLNEKLYELGRKAGEKLEEQVLRSIKKRAPGYDQSPLSKEEMAYLQTLSNRMGAAITILHPILGFTSTPQVSSFTEEPTPPDQSLPDNSLPTPTSKTSPRERNKMISRMKRLVRRWTINSEEQ